MRVLIISAVLACACAAPSILLTPLPAPAIAYTAVPTISPGDIQAAAIDAQVNAQDLNIAAVDKARELTYLAADNVNEQVITNNDQVKEQAEENFWAGEEKKWQALDALKTAEAQYDGTIANSASLLAKTAVATPYVALAPNVALAPVAPVFAPGIIAPVVKSAETEVKEEKVEVVAKSAEKMEEEKTDAVAIEAPKEAEVKAIEVEAKAVEAKPDAAASIIAPVVEPHKYPIGVWGSSVVLPPVLKYGAVAPFPYWNQPIGIAPIYNPTLYKTW